MRPTKPAPKRKKFIKSNAQHDEIKPEFDLAQLATGAIAQFCAKCGTLSQPQISKEFCANRKCGAMLPVGFDNFFTVPCNAKQFYDVSVYYTYYDENNVPRKGSKAITVYSTLDDALKNAIKQTILPPEAKTVTGGRVWGLHHTLDNSNVKQYTRLA